MDRQKTNIDFLSDLYKIVKNLDETMDRLVHVTDDIALGVALTESATDYKVLAKDIENILLDYGKKPKSLGEIERTANSFANGLHTGWQTLFDKSPSRIAELVMENMLDNIVTCYRVVRKNMLEPKVMALNNKLLSQSERNFETMKKFL